MARTQSQAVERIEYEASSRSLFVRFTSGDWYAYLDVPPPVAAAFLAAPSHGRFFQEQVRHRYAFRRLDLTRP